MTHRLLLLLLLLFQRILQKMYKIYKNVLAYLHNNNISTHFAQP